MEDRPNFAPGLTNYTISPSGKICERLGETRHMLLQVSNLFLVAAFLVPHKLRYDMLAVRTLLSIGFFLGSIWGGLLACSPDIMAWNLILFFLNIGRAGYLVHKYYPPRIDPELMELYLKMFMPLKVKKKNFKELVKDAHVHILDQNEQYSMEGITPADQRLSILLTGKIKATCEDVLLHHILPLEFVDSPEWEACKKDSDRVFQVTLTATENCSLITWSRETLETLLKTNRFLDVIIYNLVGKDITHKLYSLNDHHRAADETKLSAATLPELWRYQLAKSLSVDAVHTGTKGRVRSITWRHHEHVDRRTSVAHSESPSSFDHEPSTVHPIHYSDPGPERSQNKHEQGNDVLSEEEYDLQPNAKTTDKNREEKTQKEVQKHAATPRPRKKR